MKNWKKTIGTALAVGMAGMVFGQGSLTPPGAPAPTMKTLAQVEPRTPIAAATTITQPGSYYLATNMTGAISIAADNVALDLMGFELTGEILVSGVRRNLRVSNGTITGEEFGVSAGNLTEGFFKDLRIVGTSEGGIYGGSGCTIEHCFFARNGSFAINSGSNTQIKNCQITETLHDAIALTGTGSVVSDNVITDNGGVGIKLLGAGNRVSDNIVKGNNPDYNIAAGNEVKSIDQVEAAVEQLQQQVAQLEQRLLQQGAPEGMVLIPGGTNSGTDPDLGDYSLTVDPFYMDRTSVTKEQWDEVYTWAVARGYSFGNAGSGKGVGHPVHTINWFDAVKWCNARSQKEGRVPVYSVSGSAPQSVYRAGSPASHTNVVQNSSANGYRLPTLVEWEYAARGGLVGKRFPWGDTINHEYANYRANSSAYSYDTSPYTTDTYHPTYATGSFPYTSPGGSFAPNGYGLYDMAGNVWQWCWDASAPDRSLRGGSWNYSALFARCGDADWYRPGGARIDFGFRAVCR